jgi:hypothetical protein
MNLTATQIVHGLTGAKRFENGASGSPVHPALAILEWESTRTDVHGVACRTQDRAYDDSGSLVWFACHCGVETGKHAAEADATAELVEHALSTCAVCQGPKETGLPIGDNFPRCFNCAF